MNSLQVPLLDPDGGEGGGGWLESDTSHECELLVVSCGNVEIKYSFSIPLLPGVLAAAGNCAEYTESFCVCPYSP